LVCLVLLRSTVISSAPRGSGQHRQTVSLAARDGGMAVSALNALLNELGGNDPTDCVPPSPPASAHGERRLMLALVSDALKDAERKCECKTRKRCRRCEAQAWLNDASALFSARVCFEANGIDYDRARTVLRR